MAQNTTVDIPAKTWTQITNADATTITAQNLVGNYVLLKGTAAATAPTDATAAIRLNPGQGVLNEALTSLWPGITAVRVYAWSDTGTQVTVSHA